MSVASRQSLWKSSQKMTTIDWNFAGQPVSYAVAPYTVRNLTDFSIGGWVYLTTNSTSQIFGYGSTGSWGGFSIGCYGRETFYWRSGSKNDDNKQFAGQIVFSKWTHLCMVHSSSVVNCYVNGQLVTTLASATMGTQIATRFKAIRGGYNDSDEITYGYSKCSIATVFCTRKALSAADVASLASRKAPISKISILNDSSLMFGYDILNGVNLSSIPNVVENGEPLTIYDGQYSQWTRVFGEDAHVEG